jgi:biotin transport system substrate-specific component
MSRPSVQVQVPPEAGARFRGFPLRWPLTMAGAAALVALSAQVAIPTPFSPVPMSLQGFAVILVGGLFGSALGAGSMVLYLVAGAFGAPVFSAGHSGLPWLFGPTGGYLLAFPVAAAAVGRLGERGRFVRSLLAAFAGMTIIHLGGWAQLTLLSGGAADAVALGVTPFIAQDLLKVLLAAAVLWRAHLALRLRS